MDVLGPQKGSCLAGTWDPRLFQGNRRVGERLFHLDLVWWFLPPVNGFPVEKKALVALTCVCFFGGLFFY